MTTFKRLIAASVCSMLLMTPSVAQTPGQRIVLEQSTGSSRPEGSVRVQSNLNIFMPGPTGDGAEAEKLRERARRMVYDMAAHECDLLLATLAKDCRLVSVNSNVNAARQFNQQQPEGYNVTGSMSFQVVIK
jgi:hypothetical protein